MFSGVCDSCGSDWETGFTTGPVSCECCTTLEFVAEMQETIDRFIPLGTATETCCPACEEETLRVGSIDDNDVLYCRKCRGFLIGCETMGSVVADRRSKYQGPDDIQKPLNSRELQRNIRCPACQKKMDVHPYHGPSNVVIDSCSECHLVWLDHGELARIEIAPGRRVSAYRS